jgi:hypothetical protein
MVDLTLDMRIPGVHFVISNGRCSILKKSERTPQPKLFTPATFVLNREITKDTDLFFGVFANKFVLGPENNKLAFEPSGGVRTNAAPQWSAHRIRRESGFVCNPRRR